MDFVYFPDQFLDTDKLEDNYAIVVLNRPILNETKLIYRLWKNGEILLMM